MAATLDAVTEHAEVEPELVARVGAVCLALPEAYEEQAWTGTRWRVRGKTFGHVLMIDSGWPPVYAKAAGTDGPATVLTFRSSGPELDVLRNTGHPFFPTPWRPDEVGMVLDDDVDWDEVAELVTESYRAQAPKRLGAQLAEPATD